MVIINGCLCVPKPLEVASSCGLSREISHIHLE
ncbi:hypothetical protein CPS_0246 [Colwellia psychrerythraea 34H]|uniref:Uncharacterized protein n=1 Tax=Colwellia psychrerythraea (strain 34H / ATCC BAA-681) TaxID=167879 RepID=Q48AA0_COLP3|nr:hypothetical protein CPS_0246 [Colwellia psychrerythraea 34H]